MIRVALLVTLIVAPAFVLAQAAGQRDRTQHVRDD